MLHVFHYATMFQCFSSNFPGCMYLKDFENSSLSFIAQRLPMNRLVAWYLYALVNFFRNKILKMLRLKKDRETDLSGKEQGL